MTGAIACDRKDTRLSSPTAMNKERRRQGAAAIAILHKDLLGVMAA